MVTVKFKRKLMLMLNGTVVMIMLFIKMSTITMHINSGYMLARINITLLSMVKSDMSIATLVMVPSKIKMILITQEIFSESKLQLIP
jgi:hypothetical protein